MQKIYFYKEDVSEELEKAHALHDYGIYTTTRQQSALNIYRLERLWQKLPSRPLAQAQVAVA